MNSAQAYRTERGKVALKLVGAKEGEFAHRLIKRTNCCLDLWGRRREDLSWDW